MQLTFRQKVLGCNCEKSLFYLFSKGNIKSSTELLSNLLKIVSMSLSNVVTPIQNNYNLLVIIDEDKFQEIKVKLCRGKRNSGQLVPVQAKQKKGTRKVSVPLISCADGLVEKLVEHFCFIDNEDAEEEEDWHNAIVLERHEKSGFLIRYNELQDKNFSRNLYKDLSSGRVRITSVTFHNFIGANAKHLYTGGMKRWLMLTWRVLI